MGEVQRAKPGRSDRRDAATKVARQRLSVLELAARLGNAAEACRRRGMDRTASTSGAGASRRTGWMV
jgi:hypothetical protein